MVVSKQQTDNRFTAILDGMRYHQKTKMEVDIKVYDNVKLMGMCSTLIYLPSLLFVGTDVKLIINVLQD